MPKRKQSSGQPHRHSSSSQFTITSFDAALDVLAAETFDRLRQLADKFQEASGVEVTERARQIRWDEACKRHMVMKAMEDLCCVSRDMDSHNESDMNPTDSNGRPLPPKLHPGAPAKHKLAAGEETEWRKWAPKLGDAVLVELADGQCWPGKIIDRKQCFAGRTAARGNHFYPVRIFDTQQEPVISIKSRMIPFDLRPDPPLLASTSLLTAYNHARYPESFDKAAEVREKEAATARIEAKQDTSEDAKAQRAAWNDHVLWAMNERRVEKMRIVNEQRERQILVNASNPTSTDKVTSSTSRKRNCPDRQAGIFAVATPVLNTPLHKPAFTSPQRPISPRRLERKRNGVYSGLGEYSPRGRGGTYTPPRILPSGDETAVSPSPVPSSRIFDFVSPLGPPRDAAKVDENMQLPRNATTRRTSLEAVKEEALEDEGEGDWQVVQRRSRRGESAPCQEVKGSEGIAVD